MKTRRLEWTVAAVLLGLLAGGCKKPKLPDGPETPGDPSSPTATDEPASHIREVCQALQRRNQACEKALVSHVRGLANKRLNLEPKASVSLQGGALTGMQKQFIAKWLEHSTRELVRTLYTKDDYFKACAAQLREAHGQGASGSLRSRARCGAVRVCARYVACIDKAGVLDPIRKMFAESNRDRSASKVEPEGPWKIATYLLGMAVMADLFRCCKPMNPTAKAASKPGAPGTSACMQQIGVRPRRCAAELVAFAKAYVSQRLPSRPPAEQAVLKRLLASETGPDAIKRLQENVANAIAMARNSKTVPFTKLCSASRKVPADFARITAPVRALADCARHADCKPWVACLAEKVRK